MHNVPYWSFCWASGQALGSLVYREKELVKGKRVLDFGSGSGVVAIAAAKAGAAEVLACDMDIHAREATLVNAELNQVFIQTIPSIDNLEGNIDTILVADLLYDPDNFPLLDLFFNHTGEILLADSRVKKFQHPRFYPVGSMAAETIPDLEEGEEFKQVRIYKGSRENKSIS